MYIAVVFQIAIFHHSLNNANEYMYQENIKHKLYQILLMLLYTRLMHEISDSKDDGEILRRKIQRGTTNEVSTLYFDVSAVCLSSCCLACHVTVLLCYFCDQQIDLK